MKEDRDDKQMVLRHDEAPGYRTAFYIVFAVALAYLWVILSHG